MNFKKNVIILLGISILLLIILGAKRYTEIATVNKYIDVIGEDKKWKNNYLYDDLTSSLIFTEDLTSIKIINLIQKTSFVKIPECGGNSKYMIPGKYLVLSCDKVVSLTDMRIYPLNRVRIDYAHRMDTSIRVDLLNSFREFSNRRIPVYIFTSGYFSAYMFIKDNTFTVFEIYEENENNILTISGEQMLSVDHYSKIGGIISIPKNQSLSFTGKNGNLLIIRNTSNCFMGACSGGNKVTLILKNKKVALSIRGLNLQVLLGVIHIPEEDSLYFLGNKEIKVFKFNID
jgi:hypothetical protein